MTVRPQRKLRRILAAVHIADRPLTAATISNVTCYGPGTIYPALERLERSGWITREEDPTGRGVYQLTEHGRRYAGLDQAAHDGGPTVAEAAADDRAHWNQRQGGDEPA